MEPNKVTRKYAAFCPNCYHVIHNAAEIVIVPSSIKLDKVHDVTVDGGIDIDCPKCNHPEGYMLLIDNDIADAVSILNKIGYHTRFSCQGHSRTHANRNDDVQPIVSYPYVYIMGKKRISKKLIKCFMKAGFMDVAFKGETDNRRLETEEDIKEVMKHSTASFYYGRKETTTFLFRQAAEIDRDRSISKKDAIHRLGYMTRFFFSNRSKFLGEILTKAYCEELGE